MLVKSEFLCHFMGVFLNRWWLHVCGNTWIGFQGNQASFSPLHIEAALQFGLSLVWPEASGVSCPTNRIDVKGGIRLLQRHHAFLFLRTGLRTHQTSQNPN